MLVGIRPVGFDSIAAVVAAVRFRRPKQVFRHVIDVIWDEVFDDRKVGGRCAVKRDRHLLEYPKKRATLLCSLA